MKTIIHQRPLIAIAGFCWLGLFALSASAATVVWNAATGSDIGVAANWTGGVLPNPANSDIAQWSNTPSGPLSLTYTNPTLGGSAGNAGILLNMAAAQTGSLSIQEGTNTSAMRISGISLASGAGAFTLGQGSGTFTITLGGAAGTQGFTNNSAYAATLNSDVALGTGGGGAHIIEMAGTGSWILNNTIGNSSGSFGLTTIDTGTVTLTGANTYTGATTLSAGTLALQNASALSGSALTMASGTTLAIEANTGTTFTPASMAFSGTGSPTYNFYVNNISSGTSNTLTLGDFPLTPPSTTDTINLTGGNGYTFQIGGNAAGTSAVLDYNPTTWNAASNTTLSIPGGITIDYPANYTMTFGGAGNFNLGPFIPDGGKNIAVTKTGIGTMTLTGTNGLDGGTLSVSGGTLSFIGNASITNATSGFLIGTVNGTPAAVYQSGAGTFTTANPTGGGWQLGSVAGAYGYYNLSAGTMTIANGGELDPAGSAGGAGTFGRFDMSGGTVNVGTSGTGDTYFLPCRGAAGESSVVNFSGGTFTIYSGIPDGHYGGYEANWSTSQTNVTTISGSALFQSVGTSVKLNWANAASNIGILNLNGGLWQMLDLNINYNANVIVNFNGGTMKAGTTAEATFLGNSSTAYVYTNGATIDNNGQNITITQPLSAPTGQGVASIPVATGGAGYIMPPQVIITGGSGTNATAYASISGGAVTGITITSPGINYSSVPTVTLVGGGYTSPATVGTVTIAPNVSGGLTAQNTGTLTLAGANTYTGLTTVSNSSFVVVSGSMTVLNKQGNGTLTLAGNNPALTTATIVGSGTLALGANGSISNTPSVTVSNGAIFDVSAVSGVYTLLGGQSLLGYGMFNGPVNTVSGSKIYAGTDGGYGTNYFNNTLTIASGAVCYFDLTTNYNGSNDQIIVNGSLVINGAVHINAPSPSANLDTTHDYVLMTSTGLSGTVSPTPVWGIAPLNWRNFVVTQDGANVYLHYTASTPPTATGVASPAVVSRNERAFISVTVTPGTGAIDPNLGVTLNASSINSSLSSAVPLVLSGTANVYTNTIIIPPNTSVGAYTMVATITDSTPLTGSANVALTVTSTNQVWNGAGPDDYADDNANWVSGNAPGYLGDAMTFAGIANLNPDLDQAYTVSGLTFATNAGNFTIGSAESQTLTLSGNGPIAVYSTNVQTLNVVIADAGGGLTLSGNGPLVLPANNTYTGPTTVNGGSLNISGTVASTGTTIVGNSAADAELIVSGSGSLTQNHLFVGNVSGAIGAIYQNGGTVTDTGGTGGDLMAVGNGAGAFGYYDALGGTLSANGIAVGGENNNGSGFSGTGGNGIMDINGGTVNDTGWFVMARGATNETGILNVFSGTLNYAGGGLVNCWGSGQTAIVNILGGLVANSVVTVGFNLNQSLNLTNTSILNLNGGVAQASGFTGSAGATVNFNGGTLQASEANTSFMSGLGSVNIYSGGATINDNGNAITINQSLLAPTGSGVNGIASFTGGAGYIAPPIVTVIRGAGDTTGAGATAIALVDLSTGGPTSGQVTNVVITSPGVNYTATPTFVLSGGGATTPATITGTTPTANASGGLTYDGTSTLTLGGIDTYAGNTTINGGTLQLSEPVLHMTFDNVSGTTVVNQGSGGSAMNGTLTGSATIVSGGRFGKCLSIPSGGLNANYVLISSPVVPFNNSGTWSVGVWVKTSTAGGCYLYQGDGGWASGDTSFYLNSGGTTAGTHAGGVRYAQGWETGTATVNDGNWHFVVLTCNNGVKAQYVDGALDALTVNQWSGNGTATQVRIGGTADTGDGNTALNGLIDEVYIYNRALNQSEIQSLYSNNSSQVLPTNSTVNVAIGTFDVGGLTQQIGALSGSGNVFLDDVSGAPGTLIVGNGSNQEFDGSISDNSGAGSLIKVGSGALLLTASSSYSGSTIVSNGTLLVNGSLYSPVTVSSGGNLAGLGTLNGVTTVYGSLSVGSNSMLGQLNFFNNLVFEPGAVDKFSLTTSASGVNDQAVVYGSLTGNNNVIHISAPSTSVNLDTTDYVLIDDSSGTGISGGFLSTPVWDVRPLNYQNYTIQNNGAGQIVLHYSVALPPTATIAASPSTVTRNQNSLITVTVTPGSNPITSVTLDTSAFGGSSTLPLYQVGSTHVYTNTIVIPASYSPGIYSILATATDAVNLTGTAGTSLTLTLSSDVWNGGGGDNNWDTNPNWVNSAAPGYVGDSVTFAGTTDLAPNMDQNYTVTSLAFSSTAGSFDLGNSGNTLTLTNSSTIVNNSANAQTVNVPLVFTEAGTVNAAAGSLTLANTIDNGGYTLTVTGTTNTTISGVLSDTGGLLKTGTGNLSLAASDTFTGNTIVRVGTLTISGTGTVAPTGLISVSDTTGNNAVLNVNGGTLNAADNPGQFSSSLVVGSATNSAGDLQLGGGTLAITQQLGLGNGLGGSAAFDISGGTATIASFLVVGFNYDYSVLNQSGGSLTIGNNLMTIAAGGGASVGVVNLSGGTFSSTATTGYGPTIGGTFVGEYGTGTLNVSGSASLSLTGWGLRLGQNGGANGTVNLLGGTISTVSVSQGGGTGLFNFNGGILQARTSNTLFMPNLNSAYVYNGGAFIDDGGNAITIAQPLLAPTGYGVSSIAVTNGGSGYISTPIVTITGGTGSGASAVTQINPTTGAVTNILVVNPGSGYASGDTLTVTLFGGGGSGAGVSTPVLTANTSGGLTKLDSGTLTLTGVSTYSGNTEITNGTLALGTGGSIGSSANIHVWSGATFDVSAISFTLNSGQTLKGNGTVNGSVANNGTIAPGPSSSIGTLTFNNNLTLNPGGITSVKLNETLSPSNDLINVSGTLTFGGTLAVANLGSALNLGDSFQLFSEGGTGSFTAITGSPGAGLAYSFNPASGVLSVVAGGPVTPIQQTAPVASAITYGQTLASSTVTGASFTNAAGANVPMASTNFVTPGIVPLAGITNVQVYFVPVDTVDYNSVTNTVAVTVNKATPLLEVAPTASNITNGQALSASVLSGGVVTNASGATVAGVFTFNAPSTVPSLGTAGQAVTFAPADTADYNTLGLSVSVTVVAPPAVTGLGFTARPVVSGTSLTISGTNTGAGTFYLLDSTNVAAHLNAWTPVWTNTAGGSGSFTTNLANVVNPALGRQFYILSSTNN